VFWLSACSTRNEYEINVGIFKSGCTPPGTNNALLGGADSVDKGSFATGNAATLYVGLKGAF
jgi:hypothetical protein